MTIESLRNILEDKWGQFIPGDSCIHNGKVGYLDSGISFNYFFCPMDSHLYDQTQKILKRAFPEELSKLYSKCNGFRLFLSSLSIYGLQSRKNQMEPYDLVIENSNMHARLGNKFSESLFFGAFGRDYVFEVDEPINSKIQCVRIEDGIIVKEFSSISGLLDFFVPKLCGLYDDSCRRLQPNKDFLEIPYLANVTYQWQDLLD